MGTLKVLAVKNTSSALCSIVFPVSRWRAATPTTPGTSETASEIVVIFNTYLWIWTGLYGCPLVLTSVLCQRFNEQNSE